MSDDDVVGWVVVDFNQASHRPDINTIGLYDTRADAATEADRERSGTAEVGRRERYAVAYVVLDEDPS